MKKLLAGLVSVILAISLSACCCVSLLELKDKGSNYSFLSVNSNYDFDEKFNEIQSNISSAAEAIESQVQSTYESKPADDAPVYFEKSYYNVKDAFSKGYEPTLTLNQDGTFTLTENLAEGMGTYKGTYQISGNKLILSITEVNFSGFAGDDLKTIEFTINNKDTLTLNTLLCLSFEGDTYSTTLP